MNSVLNFNWLQKFLKNRNLPSSWRRSWILLHFDQTNFCRIPSTERWSIYEDIWFKLALYHTSMGEISVDKHGIKLFHFNCISFHFIFFICHIVIYWLATLLRLPNRPLVGGAVASRWVRLSPDRAVLVRALAGDILLCSWARHFTLTVPLSTQVYKWVPANLMLEDNPAMD